MKKLLNEYAISIMAHLCVFISIELLIIFFSSNSFITYLIEGMYGI